MDVKNNIYGPGKDDYGRDKWLSDELTNSIKTILMKPTVGRIVNYSCTKAEQELLNNFQQVAPAIITAVWSDTCVNLKILHDGTLDRWKTSVIKFDSNIKNSDGFAFTEGVWDWPEIFK